MWAQKNKYTRGSLHSAVRVWFSETSKKKKKKKKKKRKKKKKKKKTRKKDVFRWKDPVEMAKNQDHSGYDAF